jgi:uncharacterized protein (DUF1501 family)
MALPSNFVAAQAAMTARAAATGSNKKSLVVLYLGGGMDAHNFYTPRTGTNRTAYTTARPDTALADNPATAINADYQLHPALTGLKTIYDAGKLAIIRNVGPLVVPTTKAQYLARSVALPPQLLSHSDQSALWQTGLGNDPVSPTGWLGRMTELLAPAFNTAPTLPPSFSSVNAQLAHGGYDQVLLGIGTSGIPDRVAGYQVDPVMIANFDAAMAAIDTSNPLRHAYAQAHVRAKTYATTLKNAIAATTVVNTFPNNGTSNQLKAFVQIIKQQATYGHRRSIYYMTQGGYDQHDSLISVLNSNLTTLNGAVKAYYDETVSQGIQNEVTMLIYSEFGRSLTQNGTGTDHAWGGHCMVLGGAVIGGLYGTQPDLSLTGNDMADARGYLVPTTPFDSVYATLMRWMDIPDALSGGVNPMDLCNPNLAAFPTRNMGFLP